MLKFDRDTEGARSQYKHCGRVAVEFNNAIADGELDGIKIVQKEGPDGAMVDYFELTSQTARRLEDEESEDYVDDYFYEESENQMALAATAMTIGSMIASLIGTTLVQVCRDFD